MVENKESMQACAAPDVFTGRCLLAWYSPLRFASLSVTNWSVLRSPSIVLWYFLFSRRERNEKAEIERWSEEMSSRFLHDKHKMKYIFYQSNNGDFSSSFLEVHGGSLGPVKNIDEEAREWLRHSRYGLIWVPREVVIVDDCVVSDVRRLDHVAGRLTTNESWSMIPKRDRTHAHAGPLAANVLKTWFTELGAPIFLRNWLPKQPPPPSRTLEEERTSSLLGGPMIRTFLCVYCCFDEQSSSTLCCAR